jgi:glycolate oxidase FAD binding subunit
MTVLTPQTPAELAETMGAAAARHETITLCGNSSKRRMGGPIAPSDVTIVTAGLNRVLKYEPHDLTISVQAGLPWRELSRLLNEHAQMIPLDPADGDRSTVGGVVATNSSGPRRRLYGTARDLVIGMQFATLAGKLVQSGGMVVKNVAGLDMAKLMIGSFGTLAAVAVVNFKVLPRPERERSFLLSFPAAQNAVAAQRAILTSVLLPAAIDLLNPAAAATLGYSGYLLAIQAGGNASAIERYARELAAFGAAVTLEGPAEAAFWRSIQDYAPRFLDTHPDGTIVRVSCTLKDLQPLVESIQAPLVARAGSGLAYGHFKAPEDAASWAAEAVRRGWRAILEFAPEHPKKEL